MDPRLRAQQLITSALDPAATESEARNAAMAAVKLIAKHGLLTPQPQAPVPVPTVQAVGKVVQDILRRSGAADRIADGLGELITETLRQAQPGARPERVPRKPR